MNDTAVKPAAARLEEALETGPSAGMNLRLIATAGEARDRHLAAADQELDKVVAELRRAGAAPGGRNVALAAKLTGVARDTLYRRLA